jgi:hypothetical protein
VHFVIALRQIIDSVLRRGISFLTKIFQPSIHITAQVNRLLALRNAVRSSTIKARAAFWQISLARIATWSKSRLRTRLDVGGWVAVSCNRTSVISRDRGV